MAVAVGAQLDIFVLLTVLSVSYSTAVRRIERLRRGLTKGTVGNVLDVWTMAGALLLPLPLVAALAVTVYAAEWPTRKIVAKGRPIRYLVSAGVLTLAALAGSATAHGVGGPLGVVGAILACAFVNDALLVPIMWLAGDHGAIRRVFTVKNHAVDTVAKLFGVLLALVTAWHAPAVVFAIPLIYAAHRFALLDSIKATAAFDRASGMWSVDAWPVRAAELVIHAPAHVVVVLVQLYGAASEAAAAATLRSLFEPTSRSSAQAGDGATSTNPQGPLGAGPKSPQHALGRRRGRQVALVAEVDLQSAGLLVVRDVRARLRRAGIVCSVGSAVGAGSDFGVLIAQAESDLRFEEITAHVVAPEGY